jgi:magnesium transporter
MISYLKYTEKGFLPLYEWEKEAWINVQKPTNEEIGYLKGRFKVPDEFFTHIIDIDERSRIELEDGWMLIIFRIPHKQSDETIPFITVPFGIFISDDYTLTISNFETEIIPGFINYSQTKKVVINNRFEFILQLLLSSTLWYLKYLKQINSYNQIVEKDFEKSIKNKELHKMLKMEKCLVYFITSLRGNSNLLLKLQNTKIAKENEFDKDLFEDIEIELKQAIETANIYSDIQSVMMDAFASVISNNLNQVMKQLTLISIILMIPTLIASIFGMNVPNFLENNNFSFFGIILGSVLLSTVGFFIFKRRNWF